MHYSGAQSFVCTDKEGHFSIPLPRGDPLVDLQFDGGEHAPVFLCIVRPADSPLRVVMPEGKVLRGRIVERVKDGVVPIPHAVVELQMSQEDSWYQSRQATDAKGEFQFRIAEPPGKWPWMLYYAGKRLSIDYAQVTPDTVMVLEVDVKMAPSAEASAPKRSSEQGFAPSLSLCIDMPARSHDGNASLNPAADLADACENPRTPEQATLLARQLANRQARVLYRCEPFVGGSPALWSNGHWIWRDRRGIGSGDIEAVVSLAPDLSTQSVQVLLLDNRVALPTPVPSSPDIRIIHTP